MIRDEEIQKALDYLRDNAPVAAKAIAEWEYLVDYRKVIKAELMEMASVQENMKSLAAQERVAYASKDYKDHLKAIQIARERAQEHFFLQKAAGAKIDAWRTEKSYSKSMGKLA